MTDYDAELRQLLAGNLPPPPLIRPSRLERGIVLREQDFDDLVERAEAAEFWEAEYDEQVDRASDQQERADAAVRDARRWRRNAWNWFFMACFEAALLGYLWGRL